MPKPVAIRPHYRDDAAYLIRLESAVAKDPRQTENWREETCRLIRALNLRLLQADDGEIPAEAADKPANEVPAKTAGRAKAAR